MSDKPNFEIFTTPVGELVYPWLSRADTRYDPDGVYQTKLLLPFEFEGTQALIGKLDQVLTDFVGSLEVKQQKTLIRAAVFESELDNDGEETDNVLFRFKLKQNVHPKDGDSFEQTPILVDAEDGAAITAPIYGGTMARLKGQIVPYTNAASKAVGVTLRLRSVQVHELVSGSSDGGIFWLDFDA